MASTTILPQQLDLGFMDQTAWSKPVFNARLTNLWVGWGGGGFSGICVTRFRRASTPGTAELYAVSDAAAGTSFRYIVARCWAGLIRKRGYESSHGFTLISLNHVVPTVP